ncbi:hypothetical protein SAMN05421770_103103 [Granulicella rosea]|uniref:NHL repeat containing protein n=1 Tax=Granulicella rosea TaxID=474952 RepID=A0A239IGK3_9BACT|nr:hypothetical protein [Granulicella rosea]SNS92727.1 hypothetical protein SAMN05421770_103103 [Granulicella rosea]
MPSLLSRLRLAASASALFFLATGCANMTTTAPSTDAFAVAGAIQGHIHGGNQPIAFASIQLYAAGTTGYGSAGTLYATTTSADDGRGSWSFSKQANTDTPYTPTGNTWACPASSNPFMYLIARGGNTQGTHNSATTNTAAVSLIGLGPCSSITSASFYDMNEVTTVASLAALQQYFNPGAESVGAPSSTQAQTGLANAFTTIPLLATLSTGVAQTTTTNPAFTAIAEAPKVNTIANILAACINNASASNTSCNTLFANATPPSPAVTSQPSTTFATATDVLQAAYYMLTNPSDGSSARLATLFGLSSAAAPFQPSITATPTDWTVGISYYGTPGNLECSTGLPVIHSESAISIDKSGNVVVTANGNGYGGSVVLRPGGLLGSYSYICSSAYNGHQATVDPSGNIFTTISSGYNEILVTNAPAFTLINTPVSPWAIASDGAGNIFYSSTTNNGIYEIAAASIASAVGSLPTSSSTLIATVGGTPNFLVADQSGNIWVSASGAGLYELYKPAGYAAALVPGTGSTYGFTVPQAAVRIDGAVVFPYYISPNYYYGVVRGTPGAYTFTNFTGVFAQNGLAFDGAVNLFSANEGSYNINGVNSGFSIVDNSAGTSLITPYGITKPATSTEFSSTLVQNETVLGTSSNVAVDPSGNVWFNNSFPNIFTTAQGSVYTVTEVVGAGVPTVTPFSAALAAGTLGEKP